MCYVYGEIYAHKWPMGSHIPAYHFWIRTLTAIRTRATIMKEVGTMMRASATYNIGKGIMSIDGPRMNVADIHCSDVRCKGHVGNQWQDRSIHLENWRVIIHRPGSGTSTQSPVHSSCANCNSRDMEIWEIDMGIHGRCRVILQYPSHYVGIMAKLRPSSLFNQSPCSSSLHTTSLQCDTPTNSMLYTEPSSMASSNQSSFATLLQAFSLAKATPQHFHHHPMSRSQEGRPIPKVEMAT